MQNRNELLVQKIHGLIEEYCNINFDFSFDSVAKKVRLHEPTFGADEINAALDVLLSTNVTQGKLVRDFEKQFAAKFGATHGVMNNSGSSANLLALASLANPDLPDGLRKGDEVIVPALSWSTTVWPIIQMGLIPVIVDIDPDTLNLDLEQVERSITTKVKAIMPVHVYGNPVDMIRLKQICEQHNLWLVEDCCEALGAKFNGQNVGTIGDVGTYSFYFSHHISTLEGGMCITNSFELNDLMRILRAHGWIRELENRDAYTEQYPEIDPRFMFVNVGYNLRATELQGAFGLHQLPKLDSFVEARRETTGFWLAELAKYRDYFSFQRETEGGYSSCFGFPLVCKDNSGLDLSSLLAHLNHNGIETRPIICGNIAAQPAMRKYEHRTIGDLSNSTRVMKRGFSFGNHQYIGAEGREYVVSTLKSFFGF